MTTTDLSPATALLQLLEEIQPGSVLCCSREPLAPLVALCAERGIQLHTVSATEAICAQPRVDLALVVDLLEHLPTSAGIQLLAGLRNAVSPRVWVVCEDRPDWQLTDFVSLGFHRLQRFDGRTPAMSSYGYDLGNYNHKRSWNNSQYWANPQNWGKYWW
jgi:hypothetical protein